MYKPLSTELLTTKWMKDFQVKLKLIFLELFNDTFQLHRTGVGICKGNTLDLNSGSTWFVSTPVSLYWIGRGFPQSTSINDGIILRAVHDISLPDLFEFIISLRVVVIINDMILYIFLTAIGLTPGGSSTVHIYTQTIHRTTQLTY